MATAPHKLEERKPNLVRAWFDTVIRPLLSGLAEEHRRLDSLKWGWEPPVLRATAPLQDYLDSRAWKNMEQLFELHPAMGGLVEDHDRRAKTLHDAFSRLQEMIERSPELECTYEEVAAELRSRDLQFAERELGAQTKTAHLAYLATYIANGHESLYRHYALSRVWEEYSSRFLALRRLPEIQQEIRQIERAGSDLLTVVKDLERGLDELWRRLSIEHDVPLFPTEEAIPSR